MIEKYPRLFIESKGITALRKIAQKTKSKDDPFAFIVFRPFSIFVSNALYRYTAVSANVVTNVMAILAFLFSFFIIACTSLSSLFIVGLVFYVVYFLDLVDGELARMRKTTSEIGKIIDASLWFAFSASSTLYIYKICFFTGISPLLWQIALIITMGKLFTTVIETYHNITPINMGKDDKKISFRFLIVMITSPILFYILVPLLYYILSYLDLDTKWLLFVISFYLMRNLVAIFFKVRKMFKFIN